MSNLSRLGLLGLLIAASLPGTTLEQLSLDEMTLKSTAIVRAKVTGSYAASRGAGIYTYYRLDVLETWKGTAAGAAARIEAAVPGGALRGIRQSVAGAPVMNVGEEYVVFLWTSRSGLTQVMGLSQGLFSVKVDAGGNPIVMRAASTETMVDRNGRQVEDQPISVPVSELRSRVRAAAANSGEGVRQ